MAPTKQPVKELDLDDGGDSPNESTNENGDEGNSNENGGDDESGGDGNSNSGQGNGSSSESNGFIVKNQTLFIILVIIIASSLVIACVWVIWCARKTQNKLKIDGSNKKVNQL